MRFCQKFFILIFPFFFTFFIPISLFGSDRLETNFFDGKINLSSAPQIGQSSIMTLELTAIAGDCEKTIIKFRTPSGILIKGPAVFEESYFNRGSQHKYSVEIMASEEGTYALQASVYFLLPDGRFDVEHFFRFLVVDKHGSKIADKVNSLTANKDGIDVQTYISLAPPDSTNVQETFTLHGRVTYYDDNLSKPVPIRKIAVKLFGVKQTYSELIDTQYTDNDGFYAFLDVKNVVPPTNGRTNDPLKVFQVRISFGNDVLKIIDNRNNLYEFDLPLISNVFGDSVNSDCFFNESNQHRSLGHIFNCIMDAYDFLQENVNWNRKLINVQYPYETDKALSEYSYVIRLSGTISNETIKVAVDSQWRRVSMLHEYGHAVMTALYGYNSRNLPQHKFKGDPDANYTHSIYTVSEEGFAMKEGWAEFFEALIDDNAFNTSQYSDANTPNIEYNNWWNGIDKKNNNGEIVEGAVASILWDISDTAKSNDEKLGLDDDKIDGRLKETWNIMMNNRPVNIKEVWNSWIELDYGQVQSLYSIFVNNGVKVSMPYDLNGDGIINVADMIIVGSHLGQIATGSIHLNPDVNADGKINVLDILKVGKNMEQ